MILDFSILTQPDCISCGPTCLQSIYNYYDDIISLDTLTKRVPSLTHGGTLAVLLGCDALNNGYHVTLHSTNIRLLDPSWFRQKNISLREKLTTQLQYTTEEKRYEATNAYIKFLSLGGTINFAQLNFKLIQAHINSNIPLLSGVSATYFYQTMRDYTNADNRVVYDEWHGAPSGHFVIIKGFDAEKKLLHISDPFIPHPLSRTHSYTVPYSHWLQAHLLGILTYDCELLSITRDIL